MIIMHSNININVDKIARNTRASIQRRVSNDESYMDDERFFKKIKVDVYERNPSISMKKQFNDETFYKNLSFKNNVKDVYEKIQKFLVSKNDDTILVSNMYNIALGIMKEEKILNIEGLKNCILIATMLSYLKKYDNLNYNSFLEYDSVDENNLIILMIKLVDNNDKNKNEYNKIYNWLLIPKYVNILENIGSKGIYSFLEKNNDYEEVQRFNCNIFNYNNILNKNIFKNKFFNGLYLLRMKQNLKFSEYLNKNKTIALSDLDDLFY